MRTKVGARGAEQATFWQMQKSPPRPWASPGRHVSKQVGSIVEREP